MTRSSSLPAASRRGVVAVVALGVAAAVTGPAVAGLPTVAPGPAAATATAAAPALVDPALRAAVAQAPAPAVLAWDGDRTSRAAVEAHLARHGVRHRAFSHLDMTVACAASPAQVDVLAAAPGALSVWGDEELGRVPAGLPTTASATAGSSAAAAPLTSSAGLTGAGVGIAVLDTGIDGTHADLAYPAKTKLNARILVSHLEVQGPGNDSCVPDQKQEDLVDSETVSGHGTALAGIAAGSGASGTKGVAPGADLVGVSVAEQATPERTGDVSVSLIRFIAGVNYVLTRTLEGGPTTTKVALVGWTSDGLYDPYHPHMLAIRDLHDFGVSVVVAVGNEGPQQSRCDAAATCLFNRLAAGPYALGVGATVPGQRLRLEDYSSRGDSQPREAREEFVFYEPALVAPGTARGARRAGLAAVAPPLPTQYGTSASGSDPVGDATSPRLVTMRGTGVAAAQVAGGIAVLQQAARTAKGCYLTTHQVRDVLERTSTRTGQPVWASGAGAFDLDAAVAAAVEAHRIPSSDPWMCPGP